MFFGEMPEQRGVGFISRGFRHRNHLNASTPETLRLRYILAEDGCKESQVALAKNLLTTPANNAEERNFYSQLAVHWLLKAVQSGHEEAFLLLRDCANTGLGIHSGNHLQVDNCLHLSELEKISRRVAFSIFRAVMSDTEDIIPEDIFREKIDLIFHEQSTVNLSTKLEPDAAAKIEPISNNEDAYLQNEPRVSFGEVVHSVQTCLEGNIPYLSLKQISQYAEYKKWFPTRYIYRVWYLLLKSTENIIGYFASLAFCFSFLLVCVLMQASVYFSPPGNEFSIFVKKYMLSCVAVLCFVAMLSLSCFVIYINFGSDNIKMWLHLIKFFEPNIKSADIERKYLSKTFYPLLAFLIISLLYICLEPLCFSELPLINVGAVSLVLMFLVDRTITQQRYNVNISLALNVLTCLSKAGVLQSISSYLDWNVSYEVGNVVLSISFLSCITLPFVLPFLYLRMALGNEKHGWHLVLLPHWMCLAWMNLACRHWMAPSPLLPLLLLASYWVGPAPALLLHLAWHGIPFHFELLILLVLLCSGSLFVVRRLGVTSDSKVWPSVLCVGVLLLSYQSLSSPSTPQDFVLPWEKYQSHCLPGVWDRGHTAQLQINCLPLQGWQVSLGGTVSSIHLVQVRNVMRATTDVFPEALRNWLVYSFGECPTSCNDVAKWEKDRCLLYKTLNTSFCHLHNWDEYKYEIVLELWARTSPEVILHVNHACSTLVRNLKEGDSLQAIGTLESIVGNSSPRFLLQKAQCTDCYLDSMCDTSFVIPPPDYELTMKNIIWFFFYPFLQYKASNMDKL